MYLGALELDVLLGDVRSLKQKRSVIRPVLAELRRMTVSAAETGDQDLYRRAEIGVAVAASARLVAERPELQLLSVRRRIFGPED